MTEFDKLARGAEFIHCPICNNKAKRIGTQDYCDVYVCVDAHGVRIKVGAPRKVWDELASVNNGPTQGT